MGRVAAVLSVTRTAALAATLLALALWDAHASRLPAVADAWDVALVAALVIPATFLAVWFLQPAVSARALLPALIATGVLAVLLDLAGLESLFNVTKIVAFGAFV